MMPIWPQHDLERAVGLGAFTEDFWEEVVDLCIVEEADDFDVVVCRLRRLLSRERSTKRRISVEPSEALNDRAYAVSCLLAGEASRRPNVVHFRSRHLPGDLLAHSEIREWIWKQLLLEVRTDAAERGLDPDKAEPTPGDNEALVAHLPFEDPPDEFDDYWRDAGFSIIVGYALWGLASLSHELAREYAWRPHEATTFVLCGEKIPYWNPLVCETEPSRSLTARGTTERITITVDPTVMPQEVADVYRRARRDLIDPARVQPQETKRLALAVFYESRPSGEPRQTSFARWNATYPQWRYASDQVANFQRDASAAKRRLLEPACMKP